jgi:hypothetical protein
MKLREVWDAATLDGLEIPYPQFRVYVSRLRRRRHRASAPAPEKPQRQTNADNGPTDPRRSDPSEICGSSGRKSCSRDSSTIRFRLTRTSSIERQVMMTKSETRGNGTQASVHLVLQGNGQALENDYDSQNMQSRKEAFLTGVRTRQSDDYLRSTREAAALPIRNQSRLGDPCSSRTGPQLRPPRRAEGTGDIKRLRHGDRSLPPDPPRFAHSRQI